VGVGFLSAEAIPHPQPSQPSNRERGVDPRPEGWRHACELALVANVNLDWRDLRENWFGPIGTRIP
jgi:hypothetical protein